MIIVTAEQMREIENSAIEFDISIPRLMENAGSAAAAFIRKIFPVASLNCVIFCGDGNNGGDGFVVARRLSENGAKVVVVLVNGAPKSEAASQMFEALKTFEIPILTIEENRALVESYAHHADLIIDAIYGIGFHGPHLPANGVIACQIINEAPAAVVSLDIPSGIDSDRGETTLGAIKADFTVVFQLLKPAHMLPSSLEFCGDIHTVEIGIPEDLYRNIDSHFLFIEAGRALQSLPTRKKDSHKGSYGKVLAICGSNKFRGAAVLACKGALSVGVGACTIAAPELVCGSLTAQVPEVILAPLPVKANMEIDFDKSASILEEEAKKADVILFGCGSGVGESSLFILEYLLSNISVPLILDADAITLLANNMQLLESVEGEIIITPHPGEMARLLNTTVEKVQKDRISNAVDFAIANQLSVVLKGSESLVALRNGKLRINKTGNSGLSKAGSGDILAGIISGLLAQGANTGDACSTGVWLHGEAGDRCSKRLSQRSMLPSDILYDISQILLEYEDSVEGVGEISL